MKSLWWTVLLVLSLGGCRNHASDKAPPASSAKTPLSLSLSPLFGLSNLPLESSAETMPWFLLSLAEARGALARNDGIVARIEYDRLTKTVDDPLVFAESGYAYEQAGDICHALNDYFGAVAFSTNSTLLGPIWWHIGLLFEKNGSRCGHPNFGGWSELSNPAAMAFAIAHTLGYFPLNTGSNTSSLKCAAIASTLHESSAIDRTVKTWREVYRTAGGDRFSRSLLQTAKLPATENEARQRICVRAQTYDDYDSEAAYHGCSGPLPWLLESPGHHGPTGFFVVPTERRTYLIVHLYSAKFIGGDQRQSVQVQTSPETILVHYVMSSVWCPACRPSRAFDVPLLKRGYQWHHVDLHSTSTGKILRSFWWQDIAGHPLALTLLDEGRSVGMKGLECEQTVAVK